MNNNTIKYIFFILADDGMDKDKIFELSNIKTFFEAKLLKISFIE